MRVCVRASCWGFACFACMHKLSVCMCGCIADTYSLVCLLLLRACICEPRVSFPPPPPSSLPLSLSLSALDLLSLCLSLSLSMWRRIQADRTRRQCTGRPGRPMARAARWRLSLFLSLSLSPDLRPHRSASGAPAWPGPGGGRSRLPSPRCAHLSRSRLRFRGGGTPPGHERRRIPAACVRRTSMSVAEVRASDTEPAAKRAPPVAGPRRVFCF